MAEKIRVGVVFGGRSGEHEISLRSARAVIEGFDRDKYEVVPVAISKEGKWLAPSESVAMLPAETSRVLSKKIKNSNHSLTIIGENIGAHSKALDTRGRRASARPFDVVFPVLHGTFGEDGTIQGLLEMLGYPYIGCGVLASSCGMDKVAMKSLFRDAGLPICNYTWFTRARWESDRAGVLRKVARDVGYPCFVKPANLGSSVGVSKATDRSSLVKAINLAARYDRKIIVEEGLDAREIECAVMGNDEPVASLPGEYLVHQEAAKFLDYTEKYAGTGHVEFVVPAPLKKSLTTRIQRMATLAFRAIDGAGFARVDFFLRRDTNELLVNELNTIPGLTDVSGFPKMWEASGLTFPRVLDRLVELALERHSEKLRNETSI